MTSSGLMNMKPEEIKLFGPIVYHKVAVIVEFCYTLVYFVVMVHHKHVAIRVIDHQHLDKLKELVITVNKSLLFREFNLSSYVFKADEGLVEEDEAEYQVNKGASRSDVLP